MCEGVTDWWGLGDELGVPDSKRYDIHYRNPTDSKKVEAVVKEWLAHHPAPSWKDLARALYKEGDLRALPRLYGKYLAGIYVGMYAVRCNVFLIEMTCVSSTV